MEPEPYSMLIFRGVSVFVVFFPQKSNLDTKNGHFFEGVHLFQGPYDFAALQPLVVGGCIQSNSFHLSKARKCPTRWDPYQL